MLFLHLLSRMNGTQDTDTLFSRHMRMGLCLCLCLCLRLRLRLYLCHTVQ